MPESHKMKLLVRLKAEIEELLLIAEKDQTIWANISLKLVSMRAIIFRLQED